MADLIGYAGVWSVRAGDTVPVHLHASSATVVTLDLVDLSQVRDEDTADAVTALVPVVCEVHPQHTPIGSCATVPIPAKFDGAPLTITLLVRPGTRRPGVVLALRTANGNGLSVRWDGAGTLELCDASASRLARAPASLNAWTAVSLHVAGAACALSTWRPGYTPSAAAPVPSTTRSALEGPLTLWLAAEPDADARASARFDGALESPAMHAEWLEPAQLVAMAGLPTVAAALRSVVGAWDFSLAQSTSQLIDVGPHRAHGVTRQGPTRLMPGSRWKPGLLDPARDPSRFSAIHFHSDDLLDAAWTVAATLTIPASLQSGVYGIRVRDTTLPGIDVIPLWVRAASADRALPLAFLAPTYTYLAYGNASDEMLGPAYWGAEHRAESARRAHAEYGPSLYSRHPDYSGVSLASRHRPILSVRPGVRPWGFEADRLLTNWLRRHEHAFDVLTDEDVDRDGRAALDAHRTVITGNHPEYWSAAMLDALEAWLKDGGRLIYIGGNGFYWRVSSLAALPGVIECRRAEGGTRPWISEPGTYHHQLDGEPGGLWRRLGRPPQQLVGVGFAAQGFVVSAPYRVNDAARTSWAAFALDGVDATLIGTTGRLGGGAAGQEIDRYDRRLGSREDAVVLATSQGLHDATTLRTVEELLSHEPAALDAKVRADMTMTALDGGGAVFAAGSMALVGSLEDVSVSAVLQNVLRRFAERAPLVPAAPPH